MSHGLMIGEDSYFRWKFRGLRQAEEADHRIHATFIEWALFRVK